MSEIPTRKRPGPQAGIPRPRRLTLRLSEEEWTTLQAAAAKKGENVSEYLRRYLSRLAERQQEKANTAPAAASSSLPPPQAPRTPPAPSQPPSSPSPADQDDYRQARKDRLRPRKL